MADPGIPTPKKYRKRFASWAGLRSGRLVVLDDQPDATRNVRCQCDCGAITRALVDNVRKGHTRSCGCLRAESLRVATRTHGKAKTPLYAVWSSMKARCNNPSSHAYGDYGARGISVFAGWDSDYRAFADYVVALPFYGEQGRTLDRIDSSGNYQPGNLRWATKTEQAQNRRNAIFVEHNGVQRRLYEIAAEAGIRYKLAHKRWAKGWSVERIMAPAR